MIRRSFRIGLTLGLLGGLAFALAKMLGARPGSIADQSPAGTDPWPPLAPDLAAPPGSRLARAEPVAAPAATAPAVETPSPVVQAPPAAQAAPAAEAARAEIAAEATTKPAAAARKPTGKTSTAKSAAKAAKKAPAGKTVAKKATAAKQAKKAAPRKKPIAAAWVEPKGDVCPTSHPVKAKLASKIFHLPGMLNYARTKPDRCYRDAAAAESDDLRPAKR